MAKRKEFRPQQILAPERFEDIGVEPRYEEAEFPSFGAPAVPVPPVAPAAAPSPPGRFAEETVGPRIGGPPLTQEELEYLARKYGGAEAGIYAPGQAALTGGQRIVSAETGGEITLPPGQGVNLETLYVMSPSEFAKSFPAFVTKEGEFDRSAVRESQMRKEGIGPPPPPGYEPAPKPDFTPEGRQSFQNVVMQQIGYNPMTHDPYQEAQSRAAQRYPELFSQVLPGVPWSERMNLSTTPRYGNELSDAEKWTRARQAMLVKYEQLAIANLKQAREFWQNSMKEWDARYAKASLAQEKKVGAGETVLSKEYSQVVDDLRQRLKLTKETEFKDPENQAYMEAILKAFYALTSGGQRPRVAEDQAIKEVDSFVDKYFKAIDEAKDNKEKKEKIRDIVRRALGYVPTRRRIS